jgi:hypothetical protein
MEQAPAETIVALAGYVEGQKKMLEERDKMISSLTKCIADMGVKKE